MDSYDNWKTSPPEPQTAARCALCGDPLDEGTEVILTEDDEVVEEDCWAEFAMNRLGAEKIVLERGERN